VKKRVILAGMLVCAAGAFLFCRRSSLSSEEPSIAQEVDPAESIARTADHRDERTLPRRAVRFSRALLEQDSQRIRRELWNLPLNAKARDPHYDRILDEGPRDLERQAQLLSTLRVFFADKSDASVGEVACNTDFCRAELLAAGDVDLLRKYGDAFVSVLAPKGSALLLTDHLGRDNPKLTCYFGRDASWRSPGSNAEVSTR